MPTMNSVNDVVKHMMSELGEGLSRYKKRDLIEELTPQFWRIAREETDSGISRKPNHHMCANLTITMENALEAVVRKQFVDGIRERIVHRFVNFVVLAIADRERSFNRFDH